MDGFSCILTHTLDMLIPVGHHSLRFEKFNQRFSQFCHLTHVMHNLTLFDMSMPFHLSLSRRQAHFKCNIDLIFFCSLLVCVFVFLS